MASNFRIGKIEKVIERMESKRLLLSQNLLFIQQHGSKESADMVIGQITEITLWLHNIREEFGIDDV
jgi:hypothetical protein